jgi:uncharacterized membrane protein YhaH (DUF805 family)
MVIMLGFFFGFNARLGRLHYFLSSIGLAVGMAVIVLAVMSLAFRSAGAGATPPAGWILLPALCLVPFALWATISLQSMRIRDIGWNPAYVVPLWILFCVIDAYVAIEVPEWGIGSNHAQTMVGGLVNLFLTLALMFWPGTSREEGPPTFDEPRRPRTEAYTAPPAPPKAPTPAIRRDPTGRPRFGQRGL